MINLKQLRKSNNLKQYDIAKELGVTVNTVSRWELGLIEPKMDKVKKIAKLLNTTIGGLYDEKIG